MIPTGDHRACASGRIADNDPPSLSGGVDGGSVPVRLRLRPRGSDPQPRRARAVPRLRRALPTGTPRTRSHRPALRFRRRSRSDRFPSRSRRFGRRPRRAALDFARHLGPAQPGHRPAGRPGLRNPRRAGPRRHGNRVQSPPDEFESHCRFENDPRRDPRQRHRARALPQRSRGRGGAVAPRHRPNLRNRRSRRPAVLGARVRRRRQLGASACQTDRPDARPRVRPLGRAFVPFDAPRPRPRRRPPRSETGQRPARRSRRTRLGDHREISSVGDVAQVRHPRAGSDSENHRLRFGQAARRNPRQRGDQNRRRDGDAELHRPGAGERARVEDHAAGRRLFPRGDPLRDPHGPAARSKGTPRSTLCCR